MDIEAALGVLGLSGRPAADEVRRAYLREVRLHSPERDPHGFRRVRDAYDALKRSSWIVSVEMASDQPRHRPSMPVTERAAHIREGLARPELRDQAFSEDPRLTAEALVATDAHREPELAVELPPMLAVRSFLRLMELGQTERALELFQAFDARVESMELDGEVGAELGARWWLAREVSELARFDLALARGLARGIDAEQVLLAAGDLEAAQLKHGRELARYMRAKTPILWSSVRHLLEPSFAQRLASTFKARGWFPAFWLTIIVFLVWLTHPDTDAQTKRNYTERSPAPVASTLDAAFAMALGNNAGTWDSIEGELNAGDCRTLRAKWPLYRDAQRREPVRPELAAARKQAILNRCPQLLELFEP